MKCDTSACSAESGGLNMGSKRHIKNMGSIYKSGHEAGNVYDPTGISPTIKCNDPRPNMKNVCPKVCVSASPKSTSTQSRSTKNTSPRTPISEMSQELFPKNSQTSISSAARFGSNFSFVLEGANCTVPQPARAATTESQSNFLNVIEIS